MYVQNPGDIGTKEQLKSNSRARFTNQKQKRGQGGGGGEVVSGKGKSLEGTGPHP